MGVGITSSRRGDGMSITWRCHDFSQVLNVSDEVLRHIASYRQTSKSATEAGGQLFGTIVGDNVSVSVATGPYAGDDRSRYGYRSDSHAAASAIETQESYGLHYLGEWHTHAEARPSPSREDVATMLGLVKKSTLGAGAAMLLIVGTAPQPSGLYLGTFAKGRFQEWTSALEPSTRCRVSRWIKGLTR